MKHYLLPLILVVASCGAERDFPEVKKLSEYKNTEFVVTPEQQLPKEKNAVYNATMLLAWQQVKTIAGETLTVSNQHPLLKQMNASQANENTLTEYEYKSEVGFDPGDEDGRITVHTEFAKSLPFTQELIPYTNKLKFANKAVASFGATGADYPVTDAIRIVYYNNDADFAVSLETKDEAQQVILYMPGKKPGTFTEAFTNLAATGKQKDKDFKAGLYWKYHFDHEDKLIIPKFSFNIETNVEALEGNIFNVNMRNYLVERAYQRTAFLLDEKGAEIESEAVMETTVEEAPVSEIKPKPKNLVFDKPFLIILKRTDSPNPYFAAWIENTELMQKD